MNRVPFVAGLVVVSFLMACSEPTGGEAPLDAGEPEAPSDAGTPAADAGEGSAEDAGAGSGTDAGNDETDAGADGGLPESLEDEYGACARGCPAHRPYCTPAGSCSACEDGKCGNALVFSRHLTVGRAPSAATAWPAEIRIAGSIVDGLDLGFGPIATTHATNLEWSSYGDQYQAVLGVDGAVSSVEVLRTSGGARILELEHVGSRVLVRAEFSGELELRGETFTESSTLDRTGLVVLLDSDGKVSWSRTFERDTADLLEASLMPDGDVVLTGMIGRGKSLDFGGGPITPTDTNGGSFLARIGPNGEHRFSRLLSEGTNRPCAISAAPDGGFLLAGALGQKTDFGGGVLSNDSSYATFLIRYDEAGNHVWSRRFPDPGSNFVDLRGPWLSVAHDGSIALGAECGGTLKFDGGGQIVVEGHFSPCVFSLDAQGTFRAGIVLPSTSGAKLRGLRMDPWGQPVILADFNKSLVLGDETVEPTARTTLVMRTDPLTMTPNFTALVRGDADVNATALAVSSDGAIFVAGSHLGAITVPGDSRIEEPGIFFARWMP